MPCCKTEQARRSAGVSPSVMNVDALLQFPVAGAGFREAPNLVALGPHAADWRPLACRRTSVKTQIFWCRVREAFAVPGFTSSLKRVLQRPMKTDPLSRSSIILHAENKAATTPAAFFGFCSDPWRLAEWPQATEMDPGAFWQALCTWVI